MSRRPLRALLVGESALTAEKVVSALEGWSAPVVFEHVGSLDALSAALPSFAPDIVLSIATAPGYARTALDTLRSVRPATPLIVVAEMFDELAAVESMRAGAEDIVLESNLGRLGDAIDSALAIRRPLATLSPRQLEVVQLVADGHSTRAIAERLGLSIKTVESHRGAAMKRLGLHDVAGLVRLAVRMGLVSGEPSSELAAMRRGELV